MGRTKQRTGFFFWPLIAVAMVLLSGCYTILMNPGVKQSDVSSRSTSSYPREINYSDDCTSCHSAAELEDRSYDMSKYRLRSVHGIAVDPYGWKTPTYSVPWWGPAVVAGSASSVSGTGAMSNKKERQRDSGPTRGNEIPQRPAGSAGTEVQAAPQPVTTPATPATTIPSGSTIVPANNTTPAPQTPPAQISTGGERRRTSGSTRGDEK